MRQAAREKDVLESLFSQIKRQKKLSLIRTTFFKTISLNFIKNGKEKVDFKKENVLLKVNKVQRMVSLLLNFPRRLANVALIFACG
jgi:CRISPR/Cas system-associated protein Cas10 (large subunit of type III CRISPR-Cas system)